MFVVISIMFAGIGIGYLFRKVDLLQSIGQPIQYTIYLLLFILGISVGGNPDIINNLGTLGAQAVLISVASTLGSVSMAWVVYSYFFKKKGGKE